MNELELVLPGQIYKYRVVHEGLDYESVRDALWEQYPRLLPRHMFPVVFSPENINLLPLDI